MYQISYGTGELSNKAEYIVFMQILLARGRNEVFPNNCVDVFPEAAISTNLLISALSVGICQKYFRIIVRSISE